MHQPRQSLLEGASNFRDLGGYPTVDGRIVRRGLVYRSGALHALTGSDVDRLRSVDLRVAFDLRSEAERVAEPTSAPFVRVVGVPLTRSASARSFTEYADGEAYLRDRYHEIVFELAEVVGSVLRAVAHDDCLPAVIHCAAGKDRTGVVAAVLLLALGVDDETVVADYALTSDCEAAERVEELAAKLDGLPPAVAAGVLGTHPRALAEVIGELRRRFATVEDYLTTSAGLTPGDLVALRARLTE
jgi:protein-tyrosine phosphatase